MSLKDKLNYIKDAAPKVVKAHANTIINGAVPLKESEFRESQCKSCALFTGTHCDKHSLITSDNKSKLTLKEVEDNAAYTKVTKNNVLRKAVASNGKVYHRGCGCPLTGSKGKWKLAFSKEELKIKDGSGPCPMGKWSLTKLND